MFFGGFHTLNNERVPCPACDAEQVPLSARGPIQQIYDVEEYDAAYERLLETPCPTCGKTPRQSSEVVAAVTRKLRGEEQ